VRTAYILIAVVGIALIALSVFNQSNSLNGWYSYDEGKKLSEKEGKKMFIFIGTQTCSICKKFKAFFSSNDTAMQLIRENYIPVYIDALKEKPPVTVTFVPVFCVGMAENLSCFSTAVPDELMGKLLRQSNLTSAR